MTWRRKAEYEKISLIPVLPAQALKSLTLLISALCAMLISANAIACDKAPEREVVDLILNADFREAGLQANALDDNPPGTRLLFRAIAHLGEANNARGARYRRLMALATETLDEVIAEGADASARAQLHLGMAEAFRARIHMENSEWLKAYRLGRKARDRLEQLSRQSQPPQDVYLVLGLFEYYTGSLPKALRWLSRLVAMSGDRERGLSQLQVAAKHATIAAPEAARVLFDEINSDAPDVCAWLEVNREMRQRYPDNPRLSLALQRNLRVCGQPLVALEENAVAQKQFRANTTFRQAFYAEEARSLRDLGDVESVKALSENFPDKVWLQRRINEALAVTDPTQGDYRAPAPVRDSVSVAIHDGCLATDLIDHKATIGQSAHNTHPDNTTIGARATR